MLLSTIINNPATVRRYDTDVKVILFAIVVSHHGAAFEKPANNVARDRFFKGYLKPQASCSACKEDFSHISADNGPAWLTLLIIGHAVMPLMLFFDCSDVVPLWLAIFTLAVVNLISVYFILPRAKGIFIALIWLTGATSQNELYDSPELKD